jgi:hypothetical protein
VAALENNQTNSKRGGSRPGAGRKAGSATKKTREIADKAADEGLTPLEFMLQVMRTEPKGDIGPREMLQACTLRFEAAKAAAPYMHPRLAAVEVSGANGGPILHQEVEMVIVDPKGDGSTG